MTKTETARVEQTAAGRTEETSVSLADGARFRGLALPAPGREAPPAQAVAPDTLTQRLGPGGVEFVVPPGSSATINYERRDPSGSARGTIQEVDPKLIAVTSPGIGVVSRLSQNDSTGVFKFTPERDFRGTIELVVDGKKTAFDTDPSRGRAVRKDEAADSARRPDRPRPKESAHRPTAETAADPTGARTAQRQPERPPQPPLTERLKRSIDPAGPYAERFVIDVPRGTSFDAVPEGVKSNGKKVYCRVTGSDRVDCYMIEEGAVALRRLDLGNGKDRLIIAPVRGFAGDLTITVGGESGTVTLRPKPAETTAGADGGGSRPADSASRVRPARSYHIDGYMLPSPDQLGAGSCLYMSATGIAEFLLNKSLGIRRPQVGGPTDMSEQWTLALGRRLRLRNSYTDAVDLLLRGGYVRDEVLKFRAYSNSGWMTETPAATDPRNVERAMPAVRKRVIFSAGGDGTQRTNGVMQERHVDRIKAFIRDKDSPVLFTWQAPGANYWHANVITGYDDRKGVFIMRDSAFGRERTDLPGYGYGGTSASGPLPYRGEFTMSYQDAMNWGNHATGYYLANPPRQPGGGQPAAGATAPAGTAARQRPDRNHGIQPARVMTPGGAPVGPDTSPGSAELPPVVWARPHLTPSTAPGGIAPASDLQPANNGHRPAAGTDRVVRPEVVRGASAATPDPSPRRDEGREPRTGHRTAADAPSTVDIAVRRADARVPSLVQAIPGLDRLLERSPSLVDVIRRSKQPPFENADPGTVAHETAHGVSHELKENLGGRAEYTNVRRQRVGERTVGYNAVEGLYLGEGRGVVLKAPDGVTLSRVAAAVPPSLRGDRFDLYFTRPIRENGQAGFENYLSTYILNEQAAYNVGGRTGIELHDSHYAPEQRRNGVSQAPTEGSGEFIGYALTLARAASEQPGAYRSEADREQLIRTIGYLIEEGATVYRTGRSSACPAFINVQKDFLSTLASSQDARPLREFALRTYGQDWYDRVVRGRA